MVHSEETTQVSSTGGCGGKRLKILSPEACMAAKMLKL